MDIEKALGELRRDFRHRREILAVHIKQVLGNRSVAEYPSIYLALVGMILTPDILEANREGFLSEAECAQSITTAMMFAYALGEASTPTEEPPELTHEDALKLFGLEAKDEDD